MGTIFQGLFSGLIGAALCYLISLIYHRTGMDLPAYLVGSLIGSIYIYSILFFAALLLKSMARPKTFSFYEFQGKWSDRRRYVWLDGHEIALEKIASSVIPGLISYLIGCAVMIVYSRFMGLPMIPNFVIALMIICMFATTAEYLIALCLTLVFRERSIETLNFVLATVIVQGGLFLSGFYRYRESTEFLGFISDSTSIFKLSFIIVASCVIMATCIYIEMTCEKRQNGNRMLVASDEAFGVTELLPLKTDDTQTGREDVPIQGEGLKIPILEPDDGPPGAEDTGQEETEIPMETPKQQPPDETIKRKIEPAIATAVEGITMSELENKTTEKTVEKTVEALRTDRQNTPETAEKTVQFTSSGAQVYKRPSQQRYNTQTIQAAVQSGTGSYVRASQPNARVFRRSETESARNVASTAQQQAAAKASAVIRETGVAAAEQKPKTSVQTEAEKLRAQAIAQAQQKAAQTQQQRIAEQLAIQKAKAEDIQRKLAEIQAKQRQRAAALNEQVTHTQTVHVKYDKTSAAAAAPADLSKLDFFQTPALDGTANSTIERPSVAVPKASVEGSYTSQGNARQMPESVAPPADVSPIEEPVQRRYDGAADPVVYHTDVPEALKSGAAAAGIAAAAGAAAKAASGINKAQRETVAENAAEPLYDTVEETDYDENYFNEEEPVSEYLSDEDHDRTAGRPRKKGISPWLWVIPLMVVITGLLVAFGIATFNSFTMAGESDIANAIFGLLLNEPERDFLWQMGESTYGLAFLGIMSGCLLAIDVVLISLGISITKRRR